MAIVNILNQESAGKAPAKASVLVVEDDNFLRSICSQKLFGEGFEVRHALDGETALLEIKRQRPDIVLLDIMLPNLNGLEVLAKVREDHDAAISGLPVIILSNLGEKEDIDKAMKLGANDYLVKAHFTVDQILEKIIEVLAAAKSRL